MGNILLFLSPTGFYLAFFAHGGAAGVAGFLLLGMLTTVSTLLERASLDRMFAETHVRPNLPNTAN